ncbi:hypothetical protein [Spiroplasma endosymbiont of Agriotes lineatus]|uniref:hypothetical protein n=1 Tax=Spiroplasma endosymbiont of Agriotes lineatus TaxID=3077930 RepID=UPI0030CC9A02
MFALVFTNNMQKRYSGVLGIIVLNSFYGYQFISLDPNILSKNVVLENCQLGHWVSNNIRWSKVIVLWCLILTNIYLLK